MANPNRKRIIFIVVITSITLLLAAISMFIIVDIGEDSDGIEYDGTIICPTLACSEIGKSMLTRNGSAVDAALAALFCESAMNLENIDHSQGFLARVYDKQRCNPNDETLNVDTRYVDASEALLEFTLLHKLYGKLNWEDIIKPAIQIYNKVSSENQESSGVRALPSIVATRKSRLIEEMIAATKPKIMDSNSHPTRNDHIMQTKVGNHTIYSAGLFGNEFLLNLLLNLSEKLMTNDTNLLWHRMIEAFKYAYSLQNKFNSSFLLKDASEEFVNEIFSKIRDDKASNTASDHEQSYSEPLEFNFWSIVAIDVDGQIFSLANVMNKVPGDMNNDLMRPETIIPSLEESNLTFESDRLLGNIPLIILNGDGNSKLAITYANQELFPVSLVQVIIRYLLLGETLIEAICAPRFYYDIKTMKMEYEIGFDQSILESLKLKGHVLEPIPYGKDLSKVIAFDLHEDGTLKAMRRPEE